MDTAEGGGPHRAVRPALLVAGAAGVGALHGILEGAVYPGVSGPRLPLLAYWGVLALLLLAGLLAVSLLVEPQRRRAAACAIALLPLAVVVQDAFSLLLQGMLPWEATWYAAVFGANPLTRHFAGVPGFYLVFPLATAVALARLLPAARQRNATRAAAAGRPPKPSDPARALPPP